MEVFLPEFRALNFELKLPFFGTKKARKFNNTLLESVSPAAADKRFFVLDGSLSCLLCIYIYTEAVYTSVFLERCVYVYTFRAAREDDAFPESFLSNSPEAKNPIVQTQPTTFEKNRHGLWVRKIGDEMR